MLPITELGRPKQSEITSYERVRETWRRGSFTSNHKDERYCRITKTYSWIALQYLHRMRFKILKSVDLEKNVSRVLKWTDAWFKLKIKSESMIFFFGFQSILLCTISICGCYLLKIYRSQRARQRDSIYERIEFYHLNYRRLKRKGLW